MDRHRSDQFEPSVNSLYFAIREIRTCSTTKWTLDYSYYSVAEDPVTAEVINSTVPMSNGGVNNRAGILWTAQGTLNESGGLFQMSVLPPYKSSLVVRNYFGRESNSPNDVVVHGDGPVLQVHGSHVRLAPGVPAQAQVTGPDVHTDMIRLRISARCCGWLWPA